MERLGRRLKIGDDAALAQEVFPKTSRAYVFSDLPERLGGNYDAVGWEARDEGFGAILYSGRVAAAMRQFYGIDGPRYDELLQTVKDANRRVRSRTLSGENVEFSFWEANSQILMVLRRGVKQGTYDVTIALGDSGVMDTLDMTPAKAQGIIDRLDGNPATGTAGKGPVTQSTPRREVPKEESPAPSPDANVAGRESAPAPDTDSTTSNRSGENRP